MTVTPVTAAARVALAPRQRCPKCGHKAQLGFAATRTHTAYGQTFTQTLSGVCRPCARTFSASTAPEPLAVKGTVRSESFRGPVARGTHTTPLQKS